MVGEGLPVPRAPLSRLGGCVDLLEPDAGVVGVGVVGVLVAEEVVGAAVRVFCPMAVHDPGAVVVLGEDVGDVEAGFRGR